MRVVLLALVTLLVLPGAIGRGAVRNEAGLILYRSAPSTSADASVVHLWITDEAGRDARQVTTITPVGTAEAFRGAYLTPDGVILAATSQTDGSVADISLVPRGATTARRLFSVHGLGAFRPSPDGTRIAYARQLPVAGKPRIVIARRDGSIVRTLANAVSKSLSWSSDGRTVFAYGVSSRCWFCAFSTATGAGHPININLNNLLGGWPSVSPSGTRVAFPDAKGPAGERIYRRNGTFLRNLVGDAAMEAVWSQDEQRLLLQESDHLKVFDFESKQISDFAHSGPADLRVLDSRG